MLQSSERDCSIGSFGYRSCGKGVFFRFCRSTGSAAVGWENLAGSRTLAEGFGVGTSGSNQCE